MQSVPSLNSEDEPQGAGVSENTAMRKRATTGKSQCESQSNFGEWSGSKRRRVEPASGTEMFASHAHVVDPKFRVGILTDSITVVIENAQLDQVDIVLDHDWPGHYGLNGRAIHALPVTSGMFISGDSSELVAKFFECKVSRASKPEILEKVYDIAEDDDVQNHVPEVVFHYRFPNSSTATIRSRLGLPTKGARELFLILFDELMNITKLIGDPFLNCLWQTVNYHLALWKNGVHHRDVSPSNLTYKNGAEDAVGVLNDFDLATIAQRQTERKGTVPFMALELLSEKVLAREVKHVYAHDAESFVWVLFWGCARYDQGVLRQNPPLDTWLKVDTFECAKEKCYLLCCSAEDLTPGGGHEKNWLVAQACFDALRQRLFSRIPSDETCDGPFQTLLAEPYTALRKSDEEEVNHDAENGKAGLLELSLVKVV